VISFDLKCGHHHVFEVWFRSGADYESQRSGGLLMCPQCGDSQITKAVMAPAVGAKANQKNAIVAKESSGEAPNHHTHGVDVAALIRALSEAQSKALAQSEWVGDSFADRARAMYYGEADQKLIHGTADVRETREMMEEGLPVAPLLVPIAPPDQTH
jgi:hypothetical protein